MVYQLRLREGGITLSIRPDLSRRRRTRPAVCLSDPADCGGPSPFLDSSYLSAKGIIAALLYSSQAAQ